jgi:predicted metal-dependent enzyme (double-stranded beta helix superfamily)
MRRLGSASIIGVNTQVARRGSLMAETNPVVSNAVGEFYVDTPGLRGFVDVVQTTIATHPNDLMARLEALRSPFATLLADQSWLPAELAASNPKSGMGGGIGQWLLYRAADHSLSLFSLVVPAGSATPVHDHLAWGLVGLYWGEQEETVYYRVDDGSSDDHAHLDVVEVRTLHQGDFYVLLPPESDIHAVRTTSEIPSVSIHLLGNDAGCIWRHAFEPEQEKVRSFRSGYSNVACEDK